MNQDRNIGIPIFVATLRREMKSRERTQEQIAADAGVSQATVNGWLSGSIPRADALHRLSKALGVTMEYLLTGEEGGAGGTAPKAAEADAVRREERRQLAARLKKLSSELES